jgi:predicted dehydrogenase
MEVYGATGQALVPKRDTLKVRLPNTPESEKTSAPLKGAEADPLSYLAAVARGETKSSGLSSLEVNVVVTEILEAARESARTGKRVDLAKTKAE